MSFIERVKKAFLVVKKNWAPLLGLALAYEAVDISFMKVVGPTISSGGLDLFYVFLFIVMWQVRVLFLCGYVPMVMNSLAGKKIALADYKTYLTGRRFVSFLFLDAIVMLVTIAGMFLLIVPGIYWAIVSSLSFFILASSIRTLLSW